MTEVAPSGLQLNCCNKNREATGLGSFLLYQRFEKKEKIDSALKNSKGIERNLLAKRFLEKIFYSPESIKISLFASQNPQDFGEQESLAPQERGGAEQSSPKNENPTFFENRKFASYLMAPDKKQQQTFEIILPNLIHKSKKRNLH
ncbi:MAG: hypothetical protein AAB698_01000 [Patescibacteria group bacterium]